FRGSRSLHLCRAGPLLQLPPRDPPRRGGLWPAHQRHRARRLTLRPFGGPRLDSGARAPLGFIPAEVANNKTAAGVPMTGRWSRSARGAAAYRVSLPAVLTAALCACALAGCNENGAQLTAAQPRGATVA